MSRVLRTAREKLKLAAENEQDLRLAALLHDVGHYPYSHLMEGIDDVVLTEDRVRPRPSAPGTITLKGSGPYPSHEETGHLIVTHQGDLVEAIGNSDRAKRIADLFTRSEAADPQLSKLIHSSLDMDRLDYLLRDSQAAGVPYGAIDINYLLNNLRASPSGMVGIAYKALTAAEQFLFARYFMHKAVYYHKTIFGLEEAFRQLLRRCRDSGRYGLPEHGEAVRRLVVSPELLGLTDQYLDAITRKALDDTDPVINRLARTILYRKPPKLLREEQVLIDNSKEEHKKTNRCTVFLKGCEEKLAALRHNHDIALGLFLLAEPKPVVLEKRGSVIPAAEAKGQPTEKEDELIKVFVRGEEEPKSLVDIPESLVERCGSHSCRITRLYVVEEDLNKVDALRGTVATW
jgi:HD superfamily phosphohydrolase